MRRTQIYGQALTHPDSCPMDEVHLAADVLYPSLGLLLSPIIGALAMALSSVSVIGNALRLRSVRL